MSLLRYRLAEAILLILTLKLLSFAGKPTDRIWAEVQVLWQNPTYFVNFEFYILLVLAAVAWLAATQTITDFEALRNPYAFRFDNIRPLDALATRFFWGGGLIVLISGVTQWVARAGWASLVDWQRPSLEGVIFNVLLYFTLGLVLLSQARLSSLLMRWRLQNITVASSLAKQWAKSGLIFLGLLLLIDLALPTSYTLGFLASAGIVVQFLMMILIFVLQLLFVLITLPLAWLLSLLLGQSPQRNPSGLPELPILPESAAAGAPLPWLEALRSLIFWLLAGAICWYFLKAYFNDHPELLQLLKSFKFTAFIISLLASLWERLTALARTGLDWIPYRTILFGQAKDVAASTRRRRWAGLGGLSPRERILYYYLNILQRVEKRGPARQKHQTPYEYEPELSQAVPEAQPAVNLLTQAFVHARYSREPFEETQANLAKVLWQQIRRGLSRPHARDSKEEAN
jgi:hypothetical protein